MSETDCEIEYLDEDEEIVQQCVQTAEETPAIPAGAITVPLLVERKPISRPRRRRKIEEDSDYEPEKDMPVKKKKTHRFLRSTNTPIKTERYESYTPSVSAKVGKEYEARKINKKYEAATNPLSRKKLDIRIPDYDDPLCLPVRAIRRDESDMKRLRSWNNLCLEHFKSSDTVLRPDRGHTVASKRTVLLTNINNKLTGRLETTMWSETTVEDKNGNKKSEVVQCVLPKYREKTVLNSYNLVETKRQKPFHHIDEVILTKEDQKDGDRLIVYKPKDTLSLVYKMFEKNIDCSDGMDPDDEEEKRYMKEVASCRVCAPCYQVSWRGFRKNDKKIKCVICSRVCISVYNLLSHLKSHSVEDMHKYKKLISKVLSSAVGYHYKCRICQQKFLSIKELRRHVFTHRGTESFVCDIGSHRAT